VLVSVCATRVVTGKVEMLVSLSVMRVTIVFVMVDMTTVVVLDCMVTSVLFVFMIS
jgi:hypothetical protein